MPCRRSTRGPLVSWCLAVVLVTSIAGCSSGGEGVPGGDPNNAKLQRLASESVFQRLAPDSHVNGALRRTAAFYVEPGFDTGGWHGPAATLTFTSTAAPRAVFTFYATEARASGWHPNGNRNVLGFPEAWTKPYPGGSTASLSLVDLDLTKATTGQASTYVLNASA